MVRASQDQDGGAVRMASAWWPRQGSMPPSKRCALFTRKELVVPIEISVMQPGLTISQGYTFMVTDLAGEISAGSEGGLFAADTRYVSHYAIFANGLSWRRLSSSVTSYFACRVFLTNPVIPTEEAEIPEASLALVIGRAIGEGVHEDLDLTNHGLRPVSFNLEIALRSDFADLFEVREHRLVRRGRTVQTWDEEKRELSTRYVNRDFKCALAVRLTNSDSPAHYVNGRISFEIVLGPGQSWHTCCFYSLMKGNQARVPTRGCNYENPDTLMDELQRNWLDDATKLTSANEDVYRLYRQSLEDLGALRLQDRDHGPHVWLPAAGVPWYVAVFGRDSLVTGLQTLWVHPGIALGAIRNLGNLQAVEDDASRDAEPGKIPHELRQGELAFFSRFPSPYYGTADATPLYIVALHETWKWMGDRELVESQMGVAERCLEWIEHSGDIDGDGFQEYRARSPRGYENMGWKDAGDAVVYPDGSQVKQPKALCELQGYVFDAWKRMAELYDFVGKRDRAADLRRRATELQMRFEDRFWCEDIGSYCFGLDSKKLPIKTIASNAGHCLWSGIASPEHAARVVKRLMQPDMWSGWGIRTLSSDNPAYNPFSYQRGSVWPHDNGIIALGFRRYGFASEAARVFRDVSEAASYFVSYRLPELYAGIARTPGVFPVQYAQANVPQAWAAGSVAHLLQAVLGLAGDAPNGRLLVAPVLPKWLPEVTLRGVKIGRSSVDIRFFREGESSRWEVLRQSGDVRVQEGTG
jgi:glycogen debranching enzyme